MFVRIIIYLYNNNHNVYDTVYIYIHIITETRIDDLFLAEGVFLSSPVEIQEAFINDGRVLWCIMCDRNKRWKKKSKAERVYRDESRNIFFPPRRNIFRKENGTVARTTAIAGFYWKPSVWKGFRSNGMRNE